MMSMLASLTLQTSSRYSNPNLLQLVKDAGFQIMMDGCFAKSDNALFVTITSVP